MLLASAATSLDGGLYTSITELARRSPPLWTPRSTPGRTTASGSTPC